MRPSPQETRHVRKPRHRSVRVDDLGTEQHRIQRDNREPVMSSNGTVGYRLIHEFPSPQDELAWRECLARSDCPTHSTSPEFLREPFWMGKRPFAVPATIGEQVIAILTGVHAAEGVVSGNTCRAQVCFDTSAPQKPAVEALTRGLAAE